MGRYGVCVLCVHGSLFPRCVWARRRSRAEAQGIVLQVLPFAVSDAPGVDGPAALFEFDGSPPVAYLEGWGSGRVLKGPNEVATITTALGMIKGCARSPIESARLMTEIRSEL